MSEPDAVAPEVVKLIELFTQEPSLKFPDLDAGALRAAVSRVSQRNEELKEVESVLQVARTALEEEQEALLKKALRAQAYLRVYAETNPALEAQVEAIVLPKSRKARGAEAPAPPSEGAPLPKRRGRPRKLVAPENSLFAPGVDGSTMPESEPAAVQQH
jgi:hypothetical protein